MTKHHCDCDGTVNAVMAFIVYDVTIRDVNQAVYDSGAQ